MSPPFPQITEAFDHHWTHHSRVWLLVLLSLQMECVTEVSCLILKIVSLAHGVKSTLEIYTMLQQTLIDQFLADPCNEPVRIFQIQCFNLRKHLDQGCQGQIDLVFHVTKNKETMSGWNMCSITVHEWISSSSSWKCLQNHLFDSQRC